MEATAQASNDVRTPNIFRPVFAYGGSVPLASLNSVLYKGYLYDPIMGTYWLGRRHYDPMSGRFLEPDGPGYLSPSSAGGLNPYLYCYNDPIEYADASGNSPFLAALVVGTLMGAGLGMAFNAAKQLVSNGNWDNFDWLSFVGSGLLGGALGAATVLGGAAGMAYAGFSIEGYGLSAGSAFAISVAAVAAGNMLDYSFMTHGNVTPEGLWNSAWKGALKGAATFALSFYAGSQGLFLKKLHSKVPAQKFFFVRPTSSWVQNSIAYSAFGEIGLRSIVVNLPGALLRWLIDEC